MKRATPIEEMKCILEELQTGLSQNKGFYSESLFKLLTSLSAAGIIGLFGFSFSMQTGMARIEANQENIKAQMLAVNAFMNEPRFTKQDFSAGIGAFVQRINQHSEEISLNRAWTSRIEPIVYENQRDAQLLKEIMAELRVEVKALQKHDHPR